MITPSKRYKLSSDYKTYKHMDAGGRFDLSNNNVDSAVGIATTTAGVIDGVFGQDDMGRPPMGSAIASGALKGAAAGSSFGPWGAAAGAVIGGASSFLQNKRMQAAEAAANSRAKFNYQNQQQMRSAAAFGSDPSLATGHYGASFYAMGGQMETAGGVTVRPEDKVQMARKGATNRPLTENFLTRMTNPEGGSLTPMSSDSAAVNGPSHEDGGVQLPEQGAEVEGGESIKGNFVFSDRLGFADEHKRLERSVGRIQSKGIMSPERVNAVRRTQDRISKLALSQEYLKHILSGGALPDPTQQQQPQQAQPQQQEQ